MAATPTSPGGAAVVRALGAATLPGGAVIATLITAASATSDRRSPATTRPKRVAVGKMSLYGRLWKGERLTVCRVSRWNVADSNFLLAVTVPLGIRTCCWQRDDRNRQGYGERTKGLHG